MRVAPRAGEPRRGLRARWRTLLLLWLAACLFAGSAWARDPVATRALPPEAREVLQQIRAGGPFAYKRDGIVFGNFERQLPIKPRGYYHEYTVPTPGVKDRGARRIISGGAGEYFYTDDHYRTFRQILE